MMSFLKVKTGTYGIRGRPKGSGNLKKPEEKSSIPAKISPNLWAFIRSQRLIDETLSETIFRLIRQANHKSIDAQKKVEALEEQLQTFASFMNTTPKVIIN